MLRPTLARARPADIGADGCQLIVRHGLGSDATAPIAADTSNNTLDAQKRNTMFVIPRRYSITKA
jgi:hypothetical protein